MVDLQESLRPSGTTPPRPVSQIAADAKRRKRRRTVATTGTVATVLAIGGFAAVAVLRSPAPVTTIADGAATEQSAVTAALPDSGDPPTPDLSLQDSSNPEATGSAEDSGPGPAEDEPPDDAGLSEETAPVESAGQSEGAAPADSSGDEAGTATTGTTPATDDPVTTPGLGINTTITSEWEDGYCVQIEVENDTDDQQTWQVVIERDGTVASLWNASVSEVRGSFVFAGEEGYNTTLEPRADTSFGTCIHT